MFFWQNGQSCTFEAPLRAITFGGVASVGEGGRAWIAVEVVFNGVVVAQCSGYGQFEARCTGTYQPLLPDAMQHVCRVYGTGGWKAHCADPPVLPLP